MKQLALHEMGDIIRKVRKERGLRLEDLADENISPATVSNIERGVAHVSPEKITYLLDKLKLPQHRLPEMMVQEQTDLEKMKFYFLLISSLEAIGCTDEALQKLEELELEDNHPYVAQAYYYKGQCYMNKNKWRQAERSYYNALRAAQQNNHKENNMEAASYLMLGYTCYKQNQLDQALDYTNNGIQTFEETGENKFVKFLLFRNKSLILKKAKRPTEGMRIIEDVWDSLPLISDLDTALSFYALRAEFSFQSGMQNEAIHYATEGIRIAKRNQHYSSLIDLWITLGTIYQQQKNSELAETCYQMALKMESKLPGDHRTISPYLHLGQLFLKYNQLDKAYHSLLSGYSLAERLEDAEQLSYILVTLGECCSRLNRIDEAIHYFQQGIELTQNINEKEIEYKCWHGLAHSWDGRDEHAFQQCMRKIYQLHPFIYPSN